MITEVHSMFPLNDLPYDTFCLVQKRHLQDMVPFKPKSMAKDLSTGLLNRLVYHYPSYMPLVYEWVSEGKNWKDFFNQYHPVNSILFEDIFSSVAKKLDKMSQKKENQFGEILIKKSKL